jgi:hypothetical protein
LNSAAIVDLVDARLFDAPEDGDLRAHCRDVDDIAIEELDIVRLIAIAQEVVNVELGYDLVVATEFDVAHGACG